MSTLTPGPRRRSRRAERAGDMFRPEEQAGMETYQAENENLPEDASDFLQDAPQMEEPDWSAYYRRPAEETENENPGEPKYAYAPPVRLRHFGYGKGQSGEEPQLLPLEDADDGEEADAAQPGATVYHPRQVSWNEPVSEKEKHKGYRVEAEEEKELSDRARRKKLRKGVVIGCAVLVLAGAGYAFRQPLSEWIGSLKDSEMIDQMNRLLQQTEGD